LASLSPIVLSPTVFLALMGKLRGHDRTQPTPDFAWKTATVDVVVPAKNEETLVALCLASILEQDFPVRRITVVDDGSTDRTAELVGDWQELSGGRIELVRREKSIGKTPSIREVAQATDADAIVVVDADTVLSDRNYISRLVEELFKNAGVASACGEVMPLGRKKCRAMVKADPRIGKVTARFGIDFYKRRGLVRSLRDGLTYIYRSALYIFLQRFLYDGHLKLFGSRLNPIGCAVAYKTGRLRECFAYAEPRMGDNMSASEDIFIGHFFTWKGWRNVQVNGIRCESLEPSVERLPRQLYLWSSSFFQTQYFFPEMPLSLFKQVKRLFRLGRKDPGAERRRIQEQYRAPWGERYTQRFGRPLGVVDLMSLLEKVCYPLVLVYLLVVEPDAALLTVAAEATLATAGVFLCARSGERFQAAAMMAAATPIRLMSLGVDLVTLSKYLADMATGNRNWRK